MMARVLLVCIVLFDISFSLIAQSDDLSTDLLSPVNRQMYLSGTFGELRRNHFHAGIDVKSQHGRSGDSLFSIADGYVSRIMIHPSGYGNALMIDHPELDLTSVYAHMHRFDRDIQSLIQQLQLQEQSYIIDFHLSPDVFPVYKGQAIGQMGNTGYSLGPHLHFEIKRTSTNWVLNPLLFGYTYTDTVPPEMHYIRMYGLDHERREVWTNKYNIKRYKGSHQLYRDTIEVPADRAAVSLHTIDKSDGLHHRNGIYRLEMYVDDYLVYSYQMDSFPREHTRALNAHLDYKHLRKYGQWVHRLHRLPGNPMPLYPFIKNDGLILLTDDIAQKVRILAYDFNHNESSLEFYVKRSDDTARYTYPKGDFYTLKYDEDNQIKDDSASISILFPQGSLYSNTDFSYQVNDSYKHGDWSSLVMLNDHYLPIHQPIELTFEDLSMEEELRGNAFIAEVTKDRIKAHVGEWKGNDYVGKVSALADYCIMIDTIPPAIKATRFGRHANGYRDYRFKIGDNISSGIGHQSLLIEAYANGLWVNATYNPVSELLVIQTKDLPPGQNTLTIKATDHFSNITLWEGDYSK